MSKTQVFWVFLVIAEVLISGCIGAPQQKAEEVMGPSEMPVPEVTEAPMETTMEEAPEAMAPTVSIEYVDVPTIVAVGQK